jgi:uncharacterized protein YfeS
MVARKTLFAVSLSLLFLVCKSQVKVSNNQPVVESGKPAPVGKPGDLLYDMAHPNARALLKDGFFWNRDELTAPFGNPGSALAVSTFRKWRDTSKTVSLVTFTEHTYTASRYPPFNWHETDPDKIKAYVTSLMHSTMPSVQREKKEMEQLVKDQTAGKQLSKEEFEAQVQYFMNTTGLVFIHAQDHWIISMCFAQFVTEGKVDKELHGITIAAIKRQLLPICLSKFNEKYQVTRKTLLQKMLDVVNKMNE